MELTVSCLPPFAASTLSLTPSPLSSPSMTLVLSLNFIPCFSKIFLVVFEMSASIPGPPIWPRNSTTVTSAPNLDQTEPISRPMMPPPMTIIFLGTFSSAMAPVLVMTFFSSMVRPGNGVASLPVAIMMFLAKRVCSCPSVRLTLISFGPEKAPVPRM